MVQSTQKKEMELNPNPPQSNLAGFQDVDADSSLDNVQQLTTFFSKHLDLLEKGCNLGDFYHLLIPYYSCSK